MAEEVGVMLSVRGEAQRTVAPDSGLLTGTITAWRDSKAAAVTAAAAALESLTGELARLGGVPLTVGARRSVLTWSAFSATTHAERELLDPSWLAGYDWGTARPECTTAETYW